MATRAAEVRVRKLFRMGIPELACRGRQEISKWLDRVRVARRRGDLSCAIPRMLLPTGNRAQLRAHLREGDFGGAALMLFSRFQEAAPGRFFEGAASADRVTLLAKIMLASRERTVAAAEALCRGHFDLLGYHGLLLNHPVDWHLDPISERAAPLVHWSRLDPLDPAAVGDVKVVWELNRHQWLVRLGQAYRLTGDERYAETIAEGVRDWMQANPPGLGINWASSLEVALRLISWCWALLLFRKSKALSPQLYVQMLAGISAHAAHVEKYLSHYSSPNTHLTGEALGLFHAGVVFPELERAARWRRLGKKILVKQIEQQTLDGVYFEQSTCYQRYTVETYLHFLILAARNGIAIPTPVANRVQQMLDFLLAIRHPDGSMPQIGDADGGWLLPLAARAPDDFRGLFSIAAAYFGRPDYAWASDGLGEETVWLLGAAGARAFEALRPAAPAMASSRLFAAGGYAIMRSGWEPDAHQLIFDVGPLGCPVSSGHGHADLLSVQCAVFGEPYLVDPGTYCYTSDPAWRTFFRGSAAHSTVTVDGVGQAVAAGPFRWEASPRHQFRQWLSTKAFDFADASHDGFCRLRDPVVHRRRVLFVKPRYWVVVDDLEGQAEHSIELRFQFAPMKVVLDPELGAEARGPAGGKLLIRPFAMLPLKGEIREGDVSPIQGWLSPDYGQRRPAPVLIYSTVTTLPYRIVTLLFPMKDARMRPPAVSALGADRCGPMGFIFQDTGETIRFDERPFVVEWRTFGDRENNLSMDKMRGGN